MSKNSNLANPETMNKVIRFLVSFLLFAFLVGLGHAVLQDIGKINKPQIRVDYSQQIQQLSSEISQLREQQRLNGNQKRDIQQKRDFLRKQTNLTEEDFSTLLRADSSLHQFNVENPIFARVQDMQAYREQVRQLLPEERAIELRANQLTEELHVKNAYMQELSSQSQTQYQEDSVKHTLKAFFWRLLLTLPILLSGLYLFVKHRKHKYSPLVWGYSWFAVYVFFFGLVPYLPDFGGYVRYGIGAVITIIGGRYAINYAQAYAEKRRRELEEAGDAKKNKVEFAKAQKLLSKNICPSCEASWETQALGDKHPSFCSSCGISLFKDCPHCKARVFSFMPYCHVCGQRQEVTLN